MLNRNLEYREDITSKIIEALEQGTAPWQKPWIDNTPINAVTGNYYRGINSIVLSVESDRLSSNGDPRWATKKQAESQGWRIMEGAEATPIFVLILPEKKVTHSGILGKNASNKRSAIRKTFEVYHASQIQGIPQLVKLAHKPVMSNQAIDKIVFKSSARIFEGGNEACYLPKSDLIRMPYKNAFADTECYYSTLLHELAHWTGHCSRLDRFYSWCTNSKEYAREELVAEIASMILCAEAGLSQTQEHFNNHASYVSSWISLLRADPNAIFKATQEANKAVNFLIAFENTEDMYISTSA